MPFDRFFCFHGYDQPLDYSQLEHVTSSSCAGPQADLTFIARSMVALVFERTVSFTALKTNIRSHRLVENKDIGEKIFEKLRNMNSECFRSGKE